MNKPLPLFLTSLSLSSKSALGVQTKLLLDQFPRSRHLFWDASEFRTLDERSARIESLLCARLSILRGNPHSLKARVISALGRSWWKDNKLQPDAQQWLSRHYGSTTSVVYASPASIRDSERMMSILMCLGKPFVLHLWDIQDRDQIDSAAFRWLLEHALHVFCLTREMIRDIHPLRQDASILLFTREPSASIAEAPKDSTLRIALIGNCRRYRDGVLLMKGALKYVSATGLTPIIVYVGSKKSYRNLEINLDCETQITGFVESDSQRDWLLSQCHVGFLPGPLASPAENMFSRYSIPSRILDYMATGLPVLAAVHPDSATSGFMRELGMSECMVEASERILADKMTDLGKVNAWRAASMLSQDAFDSGRQQGGTLKTYLNSTS